MTNPLPAGLLPLLKKRKHFLTTLWKITRKDGVVFRFTDHQSTVDFRKETYTPTDGVAASARRRESGFEVQNVEIIGVISDSTITHDSLRAGLFINSKVNEIIIDYRHPYLGAFLENTYYITETRFNVERWEAKVEGLKRFLKPLIGKLYVRDCRHELGDSICRIDVQALSENGTVSVLTGSGVTARTMFNASGLTEADGFFTFGRLVWTSGTNIGIKSQVKLHVVSGSTSIELFNPLPFNLAVTDAFNVEPGCDKLRDTCIAKFNNIENHGGFTFIPSSDRVIQTPELK